MNAQTLEYAISAIDVTRAAFSRGLVNHKGNTSPDEYVAGLQKARNELVQELWDKHKLVSDSVAY